MAGATVVAGEDVNPTVMADVALRKLWLSLRDGNSTESLAFVIGAVAMAETCRLITRDQGELWKRRILECPGHDDEGGRDWCAYGCEKVKL